MTTTTAIAATSAAIFACLGRLEHCPSSEKLNSVVFARAVAAKNLDLISPHKLLDEYKYLRMRGIGTRLRPKFVPSEWPMKKILTSSLALFVWAVCCVNLSGQENRAALGGLVTDQHGEAIAGALVVVASDDTGVRQESRTNEQGRWSVRFLNPGHYSISVRYTGFKTAERKGLMLDTADDKTVDMMLQLGSVAEQVVVEGETPLIDTTSATSGTVITPKVMTEMPLMSRIPTLLAGLSPGVLLLDQNQNVARMWSVNAASDIRVNGGRDQRSNEFLIDGTPDEKGDRIAFIPPLDSVAEFRVMTNNYDAQYGRQAGGTINMSVKSGTKNYHGGLYEFHEDSLLNANLFQTNLANAPKPSALYNLYGGSLGGPVRIPKAYNGRDKTFFFFTYEGTRNRDPRFNIRSVPTELERQGDFSQSFTSHLTGGTNSAVTTEGRRVIDPIQIYNPFAFVGTTKERQQFLCDASGNPIAPDLTPGPNFGHQSGGTPCMGPDPNNPAKQIYRPKIPSQLLSPIALNILKFVPLPNKVSEPTGSSVNNFVPRSTRQNQIASTVARIDHNWSNNHKGFLSVRWNHETEHLDNYFDNASTGAGPNKRINYQGGLDHVWTISSTKFLDVRYAVTRWEEPTVDNGVGFDPTTLGFSPSFVAQMEPASFPRINGVFGGIGTGNSGGYFKTLYHNWNASLTHVHGKMTFHYGGEFRILQEASGGLGSQGGSFDFTNVNWTKRIYDESSPGSGNGSALASFLLGLPNGGNFPRNSSRYDSQRYYGLYFQNDWRVTTRLTLNLGLRWDFERPFVERFNRMVSDFDPTALNPINDLAQAAYAKIVTDPKRSSATAELARLVPCTAPDSTCSFKVYGAQLFNGVNGHRRAATANDWTEWQPRVGFAYRITSNTVMRGGFGRFVQGAGLKGGQNGYSQGNPFIATDDNFKTIRDTLANPFQVGGILDGPGFVNGPLTNLGQSLDWDNQDPGHPYSWEFSLHLQQEYKGWLFELGYSHNKTYGIYWGLNQNNPSFDLWKQLRQPRFSDPTCTTNPPGPPTCKPNDKFLADEDIPNPFYQLNLPDGTNAVARNLYTSKNRSFFDLIRPMPEWGGVTRNSNPWGKNQYDAMLAKVEHRFSKGFNLLASFTWSKLFEDTSFWGPEISGPITEHKLGGEDRPFILTVAPIYELPVGKGKRFGGGLPGALDGFIGGWELAGQLTLQSGVPVVFGTDSFYDGGDFHLPRDQRTLDRWFDTSHFVKFPDKKTNISDYPAWTGIFNMPGANYQPASPDDAVQNGVYKDFGDFVRRYPTRWGNVRASRVNEVNLGIFKNFRITEQTKLQFRMEAFNAFNHVRFGGPDTNPGSANFGRVAPVQQNTARQVQLALKLNF